MKKHLALLVAFIVVSLIGTGVAMAAIGNTKHDMASGGGSAITGDSAELCVYCHTPHGASATMDPLWNRTGSGAGAFTTYGSTIGGSNASTVNGVSLACLSCHDGTTSINAWINQSGPGYGAAGAARNIATGATNNAAVIGTSLTNDHPISIPYVDGRSGLRGLTVDSAYTVVKTIAAGAVRGAASGVSTIECTSCHDPHTETSNFLRYANTNSDLCQACHNK